MAVHDELHQLIDQLTDDEAAHWLAQLRSLRQYSTKENRLKWLKDAETLQSELLAKYGEITDSVSVLEEVREDRLNDLMGGR